jgi:hypothetical protein
LGITLFSSSKAKKQPNKDMYRHTATESRIKRTSHIIPTIDDVIMDLSGAKIFSNQDLNHGYDPSHAI